MGRYFGTDGFRGEANKTLTGDHAYKIGRFLGWYYTERKRQAGDLSPAKIVIGKDTRRSSYMFEYTLVGGLVASGADAYLLHVTTTPSVAYIARVDDFDCGIMISASHNPYYDNGIKLINNRGEKMDEETISLVEDYIDGKLEVFGQKWESIPYGEREHVGQTVDYFSGRSRYIGYLISLGVYSFKNVKVGLDCANGSSWNIAKSVFDALGAKTYVINAEPDGFNINRNAGSTHIEGLQKFVVENGLDVGFAYDGDADRCLCVDEKGNVVTGDHILYIYAKYMKDRGKLMTNTVVTTVMSNFWLYKAFDELGIDYVKTAVGDKYVYEYMSQHGNRIGGEQSGHIIFSKYASTGDGILTSLKMMEAMLARKTPMSKLAEELVIYPQVLVNVRVKDKAAAQADADVQAAVKKVAELLGDTGRILVRESGTEPLIRVMVEAESEELCRKYVRQVVDVIKAKGHDRKDI
ncbi:MAG: phosphoglucosamine mutase [Clostridiales bacterium]|nr:phosphoglucosamine mutase [Clostridiales bacterium]